MTQRSPWPSNVHHWPNQIYSELHSYFIHSDCRKVSMITTHQQKEFFISYKNHIIIKYYHAWLFLQCNTAYSTTQRDTGTKLSSPLICNLTFDRWNTWGKALYWILKWMPFLPWKLHVDVEWCFDVTTVSSFHHFILKFNNFLIWISCYWKISPMIWKI